MGMLKAGEDTGAYLLRGLHQGGESMILRSFLEGRSADCPDIDGRRQVLTFCFFRARRYEKEFESVQDVFELQRNLNNAFAYDLVPSPSVVIAALRAARRVNDFPTAVRIFEGTSCDQAILLGSWTRTARIHAPKQSLTSPSRNQRQGREQGPIHRVPRGAAERPGRAGRSAQGGPLPHQLVNNTQTKCEQASKNQAGSSEVVKKKPR
jgi:hypothetical protein